ncbi:MAG TPA: Rieske (2Fe-2S) protein [Pseudonocardia sp.]|jgi:phenylpropionate dioxygenase-like ring-hydroxylating dioxygenase large terminal subunit
MTIDESPVRAPGYGGIRPAPRAERVSVDRYRDQEFARLEEQKLWRRVWQLACFDDEVAEPGDFYEYQLGPFSILLVRGEDRVLRGYHNSCLHRGRELRGGHGNTRELWCKYHGWTWNLDGTLNRIPDRETFVPLDDHDFALPKVRVEQWGKWVFINMDPDAEPLAEFLGPLLPTPTTRWSCSASTVSCGSASGSRTVGLPGRTRWTTPSCWTPWSGR